MSFVSSFLKDRVKEINSEVIELEPQKGLDIVLRFKMMERSELLKNDIVFQVLLLSTFK